MKKNKKNIGNIYKKRIEAYIICRLEERYKYGEEYLYFQELKAMGFDPEMYIPPNEKSKSVQLIKTKDGAIRGIIRVKYSWKNN